MKYISEMPMLRYLGWIVIVFCLLIVLTSDLLVNTRQAESDLSFIAYEITGMSQDSVFVLHPATGKEWRVSRITSTSSPSWSPDGQWLVFAMWHDDNMDSVKVNIHGTQYQWLTDIASDDYKWSPNGKWIAFTTMMESNTQQGKIGRLYRIDSDGKNLMMLFEGRGRISQFEWSPDNTQIAFISAHETPLPTSVIQGRTPLTSSLYAMDTDGQSIYRVTPDFDGVRGFSWSPNGDWIVFSSHANNTNKLYKIRPNGSALQKLAENAEIHNPKWYPKWSPDGEKIVFGSEYSFHMITPDGFIESQLNKQSLAGYLPTFWMPNSRDIVFRSSYYIQKLNTDKPLDYENITMLKNLGWGGITGLAVSPPIDYDWHPRRLLLGAGFGFLSLIGIERWRQKQLKR